MKLALKLFVAIMAIPLSGMCAPQSLRIQWNGNTVTMLPKKMKGVTVSAGKSPTDIILQIKQKQPLEIILAGNTQNGSLHLQSNQDCSLTINDLHLKSLNGPAIESTSKQHVTIKMVSETENTLSDSDSYKKKETQSLAKSCLAFAGPLEIAGGGSLTIQANKKHGITCGYFSMHSGMLDIRTQQDGAKGIECKAFHMTNGTLKGRADGHIVYKDSVMTYSSLLKSKKNMEVEGGRIMLVHNGRGSRCITCGDTLTVRGGEISLSAMGDGGWFGERQPGQYYFSLREYRQYYSSHCINAGTIYFTKGKIDCLNTGTGGKGIVSRGYLQCGNEGDLPDTTSLRIHVDTQGDCIVNDRDLDRLDGCPKGITAIKGNLYSGYINVRTDHMGGEGIEADSLEIWEPMITCKTYDDGINIQKDITIHGGEIFCNSADNDGIDSNGSIHIDGGIVASISQEVQNESFDSENCQFYLTGGIIFGIGNSMVKLPTMNLPIYNTKAVQIPGQKRWRPDLALKAGDYINVVEGDSIVMTLLNTDDNNHCSILLAHPEFKDGNRYRLMVSKQRPVNVNRVLCDNHLSFGGTLEENKMTLLRDIITEPWEKFEINKKTKQ